MRVYVLGVMRSVKRREYRYLMLALEECTIDEIEEINWNIKEQLNNLRVNF